MSYNLNEAYYGKNMELLKVEKQLAILSEKIKKNKKYNPNEKEELNTISNVLTKMFNLEKIYISVEGATNDIGAYTMPYYIFKDFSKELLEFRETPNGIQYNDPTDKVLIISINTYNLMKLTPSQNLAIILHEIGHNFFIHQANLKSYQARFNFKGFFIFFTQLIYKLVRKQKLGPFLIISIASEIVINLLQFLVKMLFLSNIRKKGLHNYLKQKIRKAKDNYEKTINASNNVTEQETSVIKSNTIFPSITNPIKLFLAPMILYIKKWELKFDSVDLGYDEEKFADNFATSYGYGKEIAEVFSKNHNKAISKLSLEGQKGIMKAEGYAYTYLLGLIADPHPSNLSRINYAKKKLEYELNENKKYLTKRQISEIESQIKEIGNILSKSTNNDALLKVNNELNKRYNYDEVRDKAGSRLTDKEIFEFEKKILKEVGLD